MQARGSNSSASPTPSDLCSRKGAAPPPSSHMLSLGFPSQAPNTEQSTSLHTWLSDEGQTRLSSSTGALGASRPWGAPGTPRPVPHAG